MWTIFIWLRTGTSGRLLWTQYWTFRFHERCKIPWLPERLLASEEVLCSVVLVPPVLRLLSSG
jgi:hypothetical protein